MSVPFAKFVNLLSSKAKQNLAREVLAHVHRNVITHYSLIQSHFPDTTISGVVLVNHLHKSTSDGTPHYTLDVYAMDKDGLDEPIGVLHVYQSEKKPKVFDEPRALAAKAHQRVAAKMREARLTNQETMVVELEED